MIAVHNSEVFADARSKADHYLNDPERLQRLLADAESRAEKLGENGPLRRFWEDLQTAFRLVKQLRIRAYRRFPTKSLLLLIAGLLYFVWPVDLIPDTVPLLGWLDDATLLAWILSSVSVDLQHFRDWESTVVGTSFVTQDAMDAVVAASDEAS